MCMRFFLACIAVYQQITGGYDQKQASEMGITLNWELWMVVSHHVGAGNLTRVLCKSSKCSYLLGHLLNPVFEMGFCYIAQANLKPVLVSWVSGITGCASHHLVQKLHSYQVSKNTHTHRRTQVQVSVLRNPGQHHTLTILGDIRELMDKVGTGGFGNNKKPYVYREIFLSLSQGFILQSAVFLS